MKLPRLNSGVAKKTIGAGSSMTPLPRSFYQPSADSVAPLLLGHWLVRKTAEGLAGGLIVETEAYLSNDPACHAAKGETPRNRAMWGPPGHAYVYLIYGYHYCVNAVCRPHGVAEAVLIRALEPLLDVKRMLNHRPVRALHQLTSGPAKLCSALKIDRALDGADLCDGNSPLFIARNLDAEACRQSKGPLVTTTRIGISKAAGFPLRFYLEGSPFVSKRAPARRTR